MRKRERYEQACLTVAHEAPCGTSSTWNGLALGARGGDEAVAYERETSDGKASADLFMVHWTEKAVERSMALPVSLASRRTTGWLRPSTMQSTRVRTGIWNNITRLFPSASKVRRRASQWTLADWSSPST